MKKVLIVDDEPLARAVIKNYLSAFDDLQVIGECGDGFEAAAKIAKEFPDLLFLDVQMPKINGFELLEILSEQPPVIFTTAYEEYALKAFEVNALDYLLKPFSEERFAQAVQKWRSSCNLPPVHSIPFSFPEEQQRIVIKDGGEISIVPTAEVHYFEAYDDYVKIHTVSKKYLKKKTMSHFARVLPPEYFVRIHRSYIINLRELTRIESGGEKNTPVAVLKSGKELPVSRNAFTHLKNVLGIK